MNIQFYIEGIIIGFTIVLPVGPIAILCINRSLSKGRLSGFLTGMGAATADGCYGAIAGFGLTFISNFLVNNAVYLQIIGIIFLIYLSIKTRKQKTTSVGNSNVGKGKPMNDYFSALGLTITNPMTIISFAAIFAGAGIHSNSGDYISALLFILGIFTGSALRWTILSNTAANFKNKTSGNLLIIINKVSSVMIFAFALVMVLNMIYK